MIDSVALDVRQRRTVSDAPVLEQFEIAPGSLGILRIVRPTNSGEW